MVRGNTLQNCIDLAATRGGECLSTEYKNNKQWLSWRCDANHEWEASYSSVHNGHWCRQCYNNGLKNTLVDAQELASKKDGKCLSETYENNKDYLLWECHLQHCWKATYTNISQGSWCPDCSHNKMNTLEDAQKLASINGGKCLSDVYINSKTHLTWECANLHRWPTSYNYVLRGSWCPYCNGRPILTIDDARKIAIERGGKCLSTEYRNTDSNLEWECDLLHRWSASHHNVSNGSWCPYCCKVRERITKDAHEIARKKNGRCLSTECVSTDTIMTWQCEQMHIWTSRVYNIRHNKTWCPHCAGMLPLSIEDAQKVAIEKGGKCLSDEYINSRTHLSWKCHQNHIWTATLSHIKRGTWCPYCNKHKKEEECRDIFEKELYPHKFPTKKPKFLEGLELDGYNEELKLAFEYDGEQHYQPVDLWGGEESLKKQQERDKKKNILCKENDINLIRISYDIEDKEEFIKEAISFL